MDGFGDFGRPQLRVFWKVREEPLLSKVALTEEVLRREPVPSTCRAVLWAVARSHTVLDAVDVDVRRLIHEAGPHWTGSETIKS